MFERTITQFMKNSVNAIILRKPWLDSSIKLLIFLCAFEAFLPPQLASLALFGAGLLLLARFAYWKPHLALQKFEIGVMYVGYLGLTFHLILEALRVRGLLDESGTLALHTFTFLCMGVVIPAMMIRISQGHTGRKVVFTQSDKCALTVMMAGAGFRLIATQIFPIYYALWIAIAAVCWSLCFTILGSRLVPFLWKPRVDGKIH
jgi:uncharacterized protein involved in response to NO